MYQADEHSPLLLQLECHSANCWPFSLYKQDSGVLGCDVEWVDECYPTLNGWMSVEWVDESYPTLNGWMIVE